MQIATFFQSNVGSVAKLNVQRDCRKLLALGIKRHTARLATERTLQRLLRYGCGCGTPLQTNTVSNSKRGRKRPSIASLADDDEASPDKGLLSGSPDPENPKREAAGRKLKKPGNKGNRVAPGAVAEAVEATGDNEEGPQGIIVPL